MVVERGEFFGGGPASLAHARKLEYILIHCELLVVYSALNLCLGTMVDESDLYKQFSDFNYRKILFALMKWEEEEEKEEEEKEEEEEGGKKRRNEGRRTSTTTKCYSYR